MIYSKPNLADVKIIKPGYFKWLGKNKFKAASNITLIKDKDKNILVDTGSGGEAKKIIEALKKESLAPSDINIVVITHPHPDHLANNYLFGNALFIDGLSEFKKDEFLLNGDERKISQNIKILKTPGHALEDCSILVNTSRGTVAIVGDLFWKGQEDKLLIVESWQKLKQSRQRILSEADYIIPGHGKMFKVKKLFQ